MSGYKLREINRQQSIFIREFLKHQNATEAARSAGYPNPEESGRQLLEHSSTIKRALKRERERMGLD